MSWLVPGTCARAVSLAAGVVLLACASAPPRVPFEVSAPEAIPPGMLGRIDPDGSTTLYLEGLDLVVAVRNDRSGQAGWSWGLGIFPYTFPFIFPVAERTITAPDSANPVPHVIALNFRPREKGFRFDPRGVNVTFDDGLEHLAMTFTGPVGESCTGSSVPSEAGRPFALPAGKASCFLLRFPVSSHPGRRFRMHLSGLSRDGETIQPLELRFARFAGVIEE